MLAHLGLFPRPKFQAFSDANPGPAPGKLAPSSRLLGLGSDRGERTRVNAELETIEGVGLGSKLARLDGQPFRVVNNRR